MSLAKRLTHVAGVLVTLCMTGCVVPWSTPVKPPPGLIYSNVKAPLTYDFHGQKVGAANTKMAEENTTYFAVPFFSYVSFAWDKSAIEGIAKKGGINEISHADYEYYTILGLYSKFKVKVYGN